MFLYPQNQKRRGQMPDLTGAQPVVTVQPPQPTPSASPISPAVAGPANRGLWAGHNGQGQGSHGPLGGDWRRFMRGFSGSQDAGAPDWMKDPYRFAAHAMDNGGQGLPNRLVQRINAITPPTQPGPPPGDQATMSQGRDWSYLLPYLSRGRGPQGPGNGGSPK